MPIVLNKPFIQQLSDPFLEEKQLDVFVLRLDMVHNVISGNKWYKLKNNLEAFQKEGKEFLVTFGGAYSNHLVATAQAGKELGIKTIGIVRGDELEKNSNGLLQFASSCGMELIFVSREKYKILCADNSMFNSFLPSIRKTMFVVPEGGCNELGVKGCEDITDTIPFDFDHICVACGTGATLAGISRTLKPYQKAIGISVLNGSGFLQDIMSRFNGPVLNFEVKNEYHFGGYAKSTPELDEFCRAFALRNHIPIEPVYTGKLFFGVFDLIKKDYFEKGMKIVLIHTGGMHEFGLETKSKTAIFQLSSS